MRNDKGFSIVVVLLLLGVISILGSALMMMSRLDLNFTGAIKNYDKLFNLADGACGMAFNDLISQERNTGYLGIPGSPSNSIGPFFNTLSEQPSGTYWVMEVLQGQNTTTPPGYELGEAGGGGYYTENWTGEGHAQRLAGSIVGGAGTSLMLEVAVLKTLRK